MRCYSFSGLRKRECDNFKRCHICRKMWYFFFRNESLHTFEEMVFRNNGTINEDYIPLTKGLYHVHYSRWLKYFSPNQIHVVDGEAFAKDPLLSLQKVEKFLGLPPYIRRKHVVWNDKKLFYCKKPHGEIKCMGNVKGVKHPKISDKTLKKIRDFYRPHNKIFEKMISHSFNWP